MPPLSFQMPLPVPAGFSATPAHAHSPFGTCTPTILKSEASCIHILLNYFLFLTMCPHDLSSCNFCCLNDLLLLCFYSDCEVFPKNHPSPFSKVLTFFRKEPFNLEAYYNNPKELPYASGTIGTASSTSVSLY